MYDDVKCVERIMCGQCVTRMVLHKGESERGLVVRVVLPTTACRRSGPFQGHLLKAHFS